MNKENMFSLFENKFLSFDNIITMCYVDGYHKALEDFEKALLQNNVIDKSVVRRIKEQLSRHEE